MIQATVYNTLTWKSTANRFAFPWEAGPKTFDYMIAQQAVATRLVNATYNQTADKVTLDVVDGETLLKRAVVDPVVDGRLTGKVWYTGDLEHVEVYVCEADLYAPDPASAVQRTQYSQHGWLPDFDCKAGECEFETDEAGVRRLVVYSALNSHANWPRPTPLYVYQKIKFDAVINMDGLYVGDRYARGPVWYPNQNNTRFLPYLSELSTEQTEGEFAWAAFSGIWGATLKSGVFKGSITCLVDNLTREAPCSTRNPAFYVLGGLLSPSTWNMAELNWSAAVGGNTVTGPLWRRSFALNWELERPAPLYAGKELLGMVAVAADATCPFEAPISTAAAGVISFHHTDLVQYLGAVTGLVLAAAVVAVVMLLPLLLGRTGKSAVRRLRDALERQQYVQYVQAVRRLETYLADDRGADPAGAGKAATAALPPPPPSLLPLAPSMAGASIYSNTDVMEISPPIVQMATGLTSPRGATSVVSHAAAAAAGGSIVAGGTAAPCFDGGAVTAVPAATAVVAAGPAEVACARTALLEAFAAVAIQPYLLIIWMVVGAGLYASGTAVTVIGAQDMVVALDRILPLSIWQVFVPAAGAW
ncbi:hypothetical protein GPECTOR_31g349 [Gonium pectorale]|uniref:Uncharacterized protein n=1 Tax=Gonium pectorale TaxID=33097 RepID=A0A150GDS0_GONPE|nr:hypothetical protein GPECTOR_31g349 [Gonium pectorale]|eukprot:KXZ47987.1 hypothetical protein GPECTOR_31g349 [Gonium pectorale]